MSKGKVIIASVVFLLFGPVFYGLMYLIFSFFFWEWLDQSYFLLRSYIMTGLGVAIWFWINTDKHGIFKG